MTWLVSLDPSVRSSGAAIFRDGRLVAARTFVQADTDKDVAFRCLSMAHAVHYWWRCFAAVAEAPDGTRPELVFEWPRIRGVGKSPADPNDLPGLAGVGMALAAMLRPVPLTTYLPDEWTKLPKKINGKFPKSAWTPVRGKRIWAALSDQERTVCPDQHDAVDAVGIGLYRLGRFKRLRAYHVE